MGLNLIRSAFSTMVREARDCSAALLDAHGAVVAKGDMIPMQTAAMSRSFNAAVVNPRGARAYGRRAADARSGHIRIIHTWTGNVPFTFEGLPYLGQQTASTTPPVIRAPASRWRADGHRAGLKIAGRTNRLFALDGLDFPTAPTYRSDFWFLPMIGRWYRLLDWFDQSRI